MPSPRKGETREGFMDRCMGSEEAQGSFPDASQRAAFCNSQWERKDMAGEINSVEIFATGVWNGNKKITVTQKTLDQMVSSFELLSAQVDGYRPFLKLGHTEMQKFFGGESGAPSLGFISKIWREGGKILANFSNVPDTLVDLVKSGRYNAVSIEFLPEVKFAGDTFRSVLRAVALLGAELPAVKDLKDLSASLMSDDAYIFEEASPVETLEKEVPVANEAKYDQAQVDSLIEVAVSKANDEATTALSEVTETNKAEIEAKDAEIKDLTEAKDKAESNLQNQDYLELIVQHHLCLILLKECL